VLQKVPDSDQKLHFAPPRGEISRRDLLQSLVPKYLAIPRIDHLRCAGSRCELCRHSCPFEAIVADESGLSIDRAACRGCGLCIGACPRGAIAHPQFSLNQLNLELERVFLGEGDAAQQNIVAIFCQSSRYSAGDSEGKAFKHAGGFLPVEMPCLSMASPWLILRAFDLGAQGLGLVCDSERCPFRFDAGRWQGTVRFIQALFSHWGIQPERVSLLGKGDLEGELLRFEQTMAGLAPISLRPSGALESPAEDIPLSALIQNMVGQLGTTPAGTISAGTVPFGKLALDSSHCTGCGLCAADCPTGALEAMPEGDSCGLVFHQERCLGCGLCVKVCPEACLKLDRVLELDKLGGPPQTMMKGDFVWCEECGAPVAPRAMVEKIGARIAAMGGNTSRLELCPRCKMGIRPSSPRSRAGV
jgi:ferredoxin/coenzyme F420-reducing hydrogenase delta subunit